MHAIFRGEVYARGRSVTEKSSQLRGAETSHRPSEISIGIALAAPSVARSTTRLGSKLIPGVNKRMRVRTVPLFPRVPLCRKGAFSCRTE